MFVIPRRARQLLIHATVLLPVLVMLCGPCLHAVPGLGHESSPGNSGSDLGHGPDLHSTASHDTPGHCLVCQFLLQGQVVVEQPIRGLDFEVVASQGPVKSRGLIQAVAYPLTRPRPPPTTD